MKISSLLILAIGFMISSSFTTVADQTLRADKTKSFLSYSANHSLHAWTGTSKKVDCLLIYDEETKTFKKVAVSTNVADFDSKNSSRDGHALEVLDAIKYPKVTFGSTVIEPAKDGKLKISGKLNFHGKAKDITFEADYKLTDKEINVSGGFPVSMTEFEVERPSFMLIKTDDILEIKFNIVFFKN
jgi:polyisoprenoid-binding protein YceI